MTYSAKHGKTTLFVNGEAVQTCQGLTFIRDRLLQSVQRAVIGTDFGSDRYLDAEMGCYRVFNRALKPEEIAADVCNDLAFLPTPSPTPVVTPRPTVSDLLVWYKFNDAADDSATITDYSGNNFVATLHSNEGTPLPTLSGIDITLNPAYGQYLAIDPSFGRILQTLDSFTVTASIRLPKVSENCQEYYIFASVTVYPRMTGNNPALLTHES